MDDILKIDLCHPANTLTNTNDILKVNFYYLANTLTNTDKILKIIPYHLASALTNTDEKTDNFIKRRLVMSNQLLTSPHLVIIKDNNFIYQQIYDL